MPPPHRTDRAGEGAAGALARTAPLVTRWVERVLAGHDPPLTLAQYLALEAVADGKVVGAELARRAAVSQAAVSQLLAGLDDAALLTRVRLETDRRRHALALTEDGTRVLRSAQTTLRRQLGALLGGLAPHEAEALVRSLEVVAASLGGTPPPRRPPRPRPPGTPPPPRPPR
jgi:DNA-binding MarR family transcriptional regulator